jgi:hypothetical protein
VGEGWRRNSKGLGGFPTGMGSSEWWVREIGPGRQLSPAVGSRPAGALPSVLLGVGWTVGLDIA